MTFENTELNGLVLGFWCTQYKILGSKWVAWRVLAVGFFAKHHVSSLDIWFKKSTKYSNMSIMSNILLEWSRAVKHNSFLKSLKKNNLKLNLSSNFIHSCHGSPCREHLDTRNVERFYSHKNYHQFSQALHQNMNSWE